MITVHLLSAIIVLIGLTLLLSVTIKGKNIKKLIFKNSVSNPKIAFLIPARNESAVIENILISIKEQTIKVNMNDVYIIVEEKDDPTVLIASKYQATVVYRHDLSKKRKGYALDDALKEIAEADQHYDLYFIFDADNILSPSYLEEMLNTYQTGYDICVGYRNSKNGNASVSAAVSSLTFSMINTIGNDSRIKNKQNITISGTGFYIRGDVLEPLHGFPFDSLTEDYELSLYATLNGLSTTYNEKAEYYDEQPTNFKATMVQRTRWIRGFIQSRLKYRKSFRQKYRENPDNKGSIFSAMYNIYAYIFLVAGLVVLILGNLIFGIYHLIRNNDYFIYNFIVVLVFLIIVYGIIFIFTLIMLRKEKDKLNLNKTMRLKALFFNPIFLASYLPCAIKALFSKNLGWEPIKHEETQIL